MSPRTIHIELRLPEISAEQAAALWSFVERLAWQLWEAYESEILDEILTTDLGSIEPDRRVTGDAPPPTSARSRAPTASEFERTTDNDPRR